MSVKVAWNSFEIKANLLKFFFLSLQDQCCWSCVSCRDDAYVFNDSCLSCKPGWAPNENKTECYKLKAEVIPWDSPWAIVPLVFSTVGIFMTLFTFSIFIKYNSTPIIMASGRELCYVSIWKFLLDYIIIKRLVTIGNGFFDASSSEIKVAIYEKKGLTCSRM